MPYADPFALPELYDIVVIAGVASPGVAKVSRGGRKYKWDKKDGPGTAGANVTFRGIDLCEFSIELTMWNSEQLAAWDVWRDLWQWDPTKKVKGKTPKIQPVDIMHPILDGLGVHWAMPVEVGQLEYQGGGKWTATISAMEYKPPGKKNVTGSPSGTQNTTAPTTAAGGTPVKSAADERDEQIVALLAQAKAA